MSSVEGDHHLNETCLSNSTDVSVDNHQNDHISNGDQIPVVVSEVTENSKDHEKGDNIECKSTDLHVEEQISNQPEVIDTSSSKLENNENSDSIEQLKSILRLDDEQFENLQKWMQKYKQDIIEKYETHLCDLVKEKNILQEKMINIEEEKQQYVDLNKQLEDNQTDLNCKLEKINRVAEGRKKELEVMVVKYAMSENQIITMKNKKDEFEKKYKDALKDKDSLMVRIKGLSNEKQMLINQLDQKISDLSGNNKEMNKMQMQLKEKEAQIIQMTFSLQQEQEAHRTCKDNLKECSQKVQQLKKDMEQVKEQTEMEVKTSEAVQKLEVQLQQERNAFQSKVKQLEQENESFLNKIQKLEQQKFAYEEQNEQTVQTIKRLQNHVAELEVYKSKLMQMEQNVQNLQQDNEEQKRQLEQVRNENAELQKEMDSCRQKEGELLEFTERMQSKTVNLQSDHIVLEQKYNESCTELIDLRQKHKKLVEQVSEMDKRLQDALAEANQAKEQLDKSNQQLDDHKQNHRKVKEELENEIRVLRKRHVQNVKELNKELQSLRKKLELSDADSNSQADASSNCSKTNSMTSLEKTASLVQETGNENGTASADNTSVVLTNADGEVVIQVDKQKLIYKIVSLQKQMAKKRERIEFLEEHNNQLTEEIKKKTKIIQNYILREEAGALTTNDMDNYKEQITKRNTGIMSSLYRNTTSDSAMTLEFSLEINRKLQAVLEDTLLKNITLKENINTLGNEIARITNSQ